jgi:hypothetical protein
MTEALLVILALGHIGYIPIAAALGVNEMRVFYLLQGAIGAGFFALAGLVLNRKTWPKKVTAALRFVALFGVYEQLLMIGCGVPRLWAETFRTPPGQGLCGSRWTALNFALFTWLIVYVVAALYGRASK